MCYHADVFREPRAMAAVTIRNLPDNVHRALMQRAARHKRSTEAEMRAILEATVQPQDRPHLGSAIVALSRKDGVTRADVEALERARDATPAEPLRFE
jgi:plasmid stability protein